MKQIKHMTQVKAFRERLVIEVDSNHTGAKYTHQYYMERESGRLKALTENLVTDSITFLTTDIAELAENPEILEKENDRWIKVVFKDTWKLIFVVSQCDGDVMIRSLHSLNSKPKDLGILTWQGSHVVLYAWEMWLRGQGES